MKKLLLSALAIASIGTGCAVLAQTVEGLDLDAIRASNAHFARKFAQGAPVLDRIDAMLFD